MNENNTFEYALKRTQILKMPNQNISTFGPTNIEYYILSKFNKGTRIRNGKVISSRPEIIKPYEIAELFEGFGENSPEFAEEIFRRIGNNPRILNYKFKNMPGTTSESSASINEVFIKIKNDVEKNGKNLSTIIKGFENTWQISIMKFIVDMTLKSAGDNISDMEQRGLFPDEHGVPEYVRNKIEYLFKQAQKNDTKINELGKSLNEYNLFKEYEDRFFKLFK